jgi:L-lactate dehydrogenase complex protein LldF
MTTVDLGMPPVAPRGTGVLRSGKSFPEHAHTELADPLLRKNLRHAMSTIRAKRARAVAEVDDWEELRQAGASLKRHVMANLDSYLVRLEEAVEAAGGHVHWARDAVEANRIVVDLVRATGETQVLKIKSMATQEIALDEALSDAGVDTYETDLAELIVQLGRDWPSHIIVPAVHKNREQIRQIFLDRMPDAPRDLTDDPSDLCDAARRHLRKKFLTSKVAISGANFACADTGTFVIVESEGNGRMNLSLPDTLITVMGIEKVIPSFSDLEVFLQLLPRSSSGERMTPYVSTWQGPYEGDGPQDFHVVLLDNGRTHVLADAQGRDALNCIRCSACLNVCPVYERTGGHAYGSIYPGPIGAILTPQLLGVEEAASLPFASSLCGACGDACPVAIDIPAILVHLRDEAARAKDDASRLPSAEKAAMQAMAWAMSDGRRFAAAGRMAPLSRLAGRGRLPVLPPPLSGWTQSRDIPKAPTETFRQWWRKRGAG